MNLKDAGGKPIEIDLAIVTPVLQNWQRPTSSTGEDLMLSLGLSAPHRSLVLALLSAVGLASDLKMQSLAAGAPVAAEHYARAVFAKPPAGLSKPDSLAVVGAQVWIGYGNTGKKDGADGATSQVVEYAMDGKVLKTLTIAGHNDGLKVEPKTGKIWAIQNEDGNPTLIIIDPATDKMQSYTLPPAGHGGGYDDVVFRDGEAFMTASAPETDSGKINPGPSVVRVMIGDDGKVSIDSFFPGAPKIANVVTGKIETLNLTDPDSITQAPSGDLVMTSQDDGELIYIHKTAANKPEGKVLHLLHDVKVDDTAFVTAEKGFLLVADTAADVVWKITAPQWTVGAAFSSMSGVDATATTKAQAGYVGALDQKTGELKPIVANMDAPHGLIFVSMP